MKLFWGGMSFAVFILAISSARAADEPLWKKNCGKDEAGKTHCVVEQYAIAMPQKVSLMRVRFGKIGKDDQLGLSLSAPLGVQLPPGLTLSMDGAKPIALPFERCDAQGCLAQAVLDKSAGEKFAKGKTLVVHYVLSEKQPLDVPIRLEGLAEALKGL